MTYNVFGGTFNLTLTIYPMVKEYSKRLTVDEVLAKSSTPPFFVTVYIVFSQSIACHAPHGLAVEVLCIYPSVCLSVYLSYLNCDKTK